MPGVPGAGGPTPKRSNQKHGHRSQAEKDLIDHAPGAAEVLVPSVNQKWHPIAKRWFESLAASGQVAFFEPSDWAVAELIAESMSRDLRPQLVGTSERVETDPETGISFTRSEPILMAIPLKGASLAAYLKAFGSLMATEGDRRRARVELERPGTGGDVDVAGVSELDEYRDRLSG